MDNFCTMWIPEEYIRNLYNIYINITIICLNRK